VIGPIWRVQLIPGSTKHVPDVLEGIQFPQLVHELLRLGHGQLVAYQEFEIAF